LSAHNAINSFSAGCASILPQQLEQHRAQRAAGVRDFAQHRQRGLTHLQQTGRGTA
jgi:hypothetical protein